MTYVIAAACIDVMDQSCIEVCPVDCIFFEDDDRMCYIEPVACIDCGVCESACPVGAIFAEDKLPQDVAPFLEINAGWFGDKVTTRDKVDTFLQENPSIV